MNVNALAQNLIVPLVAIIGLIVLTALNDVSSNVTIPIIAGLAGVHIGANVVPTTTTTSVTGTDVTPPIQ